MLNKGAVSEKIPTISEETNVEDALEILKKSKADVVPIMDAAGQPVGLFSIPILLKNILPVSVAMSDGVQIDVTVSAAPGIGKRLKNIALVRVGDVMDRKIYSISEEASLWEALQILLLNNNMPLIVLNAQTGKFSGLITAQSAFDELNRTKDDDS